MAEINEIRTQLRLPADLHARINEAAKVSGRSMNAEIVHRLETSFLPDEERRAQVDEFTALTRKLEELIESSEALRALKVPNQSTAHKKPRARRG